jgi:hypothetical protein
MVPQTIVLPLNDGHPSKSFFFLVPSVGIEPTSTA